MKHFWFNWLPWKYVVRRVARANGFMDPIALLSRLYGFAQPSEVAAPVELLRAGVVFHARGLMNTKAIQQNLDWVWPYWVERQFDPKDLAFLPRAFSVTHVNLTLRNWTAVGTPGCNALPIVDPRGLVTPFFDGWSVDCWLMADDGSELIPSKCDQVDQRLLLPSDGLGVRTTCEAKGMTLESTTVVLPEEHAPLCRTTYAAIADKGGWLVVIVRPYNPEGVSFLHAVSFDEHERSLCLNGRKSVLLGESPSRFVTSNYDSGDVYLGLLNRTDSNRVECRVGLATAAALYRIEPSQRRTIAVDARLTEDIESQPLYRTGSAVETWRAALGGVARLAVPDDRVQFLYDAAIRTLVLHSPREVYPGPYTYKRFWFRDAVFIIHAMLCAGMKKRAEALIDLFPPKQRLTGFFHSQDGEWDSNGEVVWLMERFATLTGQPLKPAWLRSIVRGAEWIVFKRLPDSGGRLESGLMPAGFSAEHLGNNDFYYWDDFWSVAGLRAAARVCTDESTCARFRNHAEKLMAAIERSHGESFKKRGRPAFPASPYRRMDVGAVGSIVADYPLQLFEPGDERVMDTVHYLMEQCFVQGAFFQDMIHSGINAYLTLQIAQVLLRAGDARAFQLFHTIGNLASPTGQWPEAIHPHTHGGCMGDGQHVWAAAEWVLFVRNMFVREEGDGLILGSGLPSEWLSGNTPLRFGPAPTPYGDILVELRPETEGVTVSWESQWRDRCPSIAVQIPGFGTAEPLEESTCRYWCERRTAVRESS